MTDIFDFLRAALPWLAIGFWLAYTFAAKKEGKSGQRITWGCYAPSVAMVFVALMEFYDRDFSSGATWLILAVAFLALNVLQVNKKKNRRTGELIMSKRQKLSVVYFTVAAICYCFSLYSLIRAGSVSYTSVVGLCIGSLWMSLGALYLNKSKRDDKQWTINDKETEKIQ